LPTTSALAAPGDPVDRDWRFLVFGRATGKAIPIISTELPSAGFHSAYKHQTDVTSDLSQQRESRWSIGCLQDAKSIFDQNALDRPTRVIIPLYYQYCVRQLESPAIRRRNIERGKYPKQCERSRRRWSQQLLANPNEGLPSTDSTTAIRSSDVKGFEKNSRPGPAEPR
jgi:hypothetical protein